MGEVARDDAPIEDTSDGAGAQSRKRRTKIRSGRCFRVGIFLLSMFSFTSLDRILTFLLRPSTTPNRTIAISEDTAYAKWTEQERDKRQMKFARSKEIIPIWMAKYLTWHIEQRQKLRYNTSLSGDDDIKYLVVRCLEREKCGGLSDRMQPMPFYVMLANLTQRVLLIHWKKPCELENFWQPPPNGLDWRISGTPVTINDIRSNTNFFNGHTNSLSREVRMLAGLLDGGDKAHLQSCKVLNILLDGGQKVWWARDLFNQWRREPNQDTPTWSGGQAYLGWNKNQTAIKKHDLTEDVFRILFEPSPEVEKDIFNMMSDLEIINKEYNVVQVRAKDPRSFPEDAIREFAEHLHPGQNLNAYQVSQEAWKMDMTENNDITGKMKSFFLQKFSNAIACVEQQVPGLPIYLASDSKFRNYMQNVSTLPIRVPSSSETKGDPLHVDSDDNQGRDPSDFYQVFMDVYVMSQARCLSHSGGFGVFALRWNNNLTCEVAHAGKVCVDPKATNESAKHST